MKKLYVAYGSNLHLEQMAHRCPDAKVYGSGVVKNYELTFWGSGRRGGVATILPHRGTDVPVGVFEISDDDEKNLDVYEGWPHLYRKENITVLLNNGKKVKGMVYVMNYGTPSYPSDYYYNVIKSGYQSFGFDVSFLKKAADDVAKKIDDDYDMSQCSFMRLIKD